MRRLLLLVPFLLAAPALAQPTGTLAGRVTDAATGQGLPGANVFLEGTQLGTATDIDGHNRIIGIPAGDYTVTARFVGFGTGTVASVSIRPGYTTQHNFALGVGASLGEVRSCHCFRPRLLDPDPFASRIVVGDDWWGCCGTAGIRDLPIGW